MGARAGQWCTQEGCRPGSEQWLFLSPHTATAALHPGGGGWEPGRKLILPAVQKLTGQLGKWEVGDQKEALRLGHAADGD